MNGEAGLRIDHSFLKTYAILPSAHHSGPNEKTAMKSNEQPSGNGATSSMGDRARRVRCLILT